jgi:hypothetical protein
MVCRSSADSGMGDFSFFKTVSLNRERFFCFSGGLYGVPAGGDRGYPDGDECENSDARCEWRKYRRFSRMYGRQPEKYVVKQAETG